MFAYGNVALNNSIENVSKKEWQKIVNKGVVILKQLIKKCKYRDYIFLAQIELAKYEHYMGNNDKAITMFKNIKPVNKQEEKRVNFYINMWKNR